MKKSAFFIIVLISFIFAQDKDPYEELIKETVTEEYCKEVISNIIKLLEEGYVYLDFYKSPIKPTANECYSIEAIDLIKELKDIPTKDRKFYEFIRDIYKIMRKTGDGHLAFLCDTSPNNIFLAKYFFRIPFSFEVVDEFNDDGERNDTYLIITNHTDDSENEYDEDFIPPFNKIASPTSLYSYFNKKIESINGEDPFKFIENFYGDFKFYHSQQANFIDTLDSIKEINIEMYPFFKEELTNITIIFEEGEELTVNYEFFSEDQFGSNEFASYYLEKVKKNIIDNRPIQTIKEVYKEFKKKKNLNKKKIRKAQEEEVEWDYKDTQELIKCKVDHDNKKNVLYQKSFSPTYYLNYEEIMLKCLDAFYSNDYPIIIIESRNGGGYSELCFPMTQYLRPKILGTLLNSFKNTDLVYETFINSDENLNNETCKPYDSKEKLKRERVDDYGNGIIHNRTNEIEFYSVYSKKMVEENRRKYIATNNTKKPTEIIIYTD